jgi:hypothetical protein
LERESLIAQRKANAKEQLTRKHELMRNLERMQVQNSFLDFDVEGNRARPPESSAAGRGGGRARARRARGCLLR